VPPLTAFLAITGCFCAQGPLIYWVANHRRHHRHSDKPGDPHSPFVDMKSNAITKVAKGFWHAHLGWQVNHETPNTALFAKDLLKHKLVFKLNKTYFLWVTVGILIPTLIGFAVYAHWHGLIMGMIWGGLGRIFIVNQVTFSINSLCHLYGKQPFDTGEGSRNNALLAIPTFGQAWHNNHHAFPYSAIVGLKKSQIDLGGLTIRLFEKLKWASRVKRPNDTQIQQKVNQS
jgi:stearoyl-CoA desaturase (delta-9 desaturase)